MASWQTRLTRLLDDERYHVCGLAVVSLVMHLAVIHQPSFFASDEFYYVQEANRIVNSQNGLNYCHPSLGTLMIAAGISVFGFNPWGWRIFPVIFSVVSVILFYLICRRLGGKRTALFAGLLFTFENLTFYICGLGLLDTFFIMFMLLSFLLYLQNRYALSGMSLALSCLCKLPGLFGVLVIFGHWIITRRRQGIRNVLVFPAFLVATFFLLLPVTDFLVSGEWLNPLGRLYHIAFTHIGTKVSELGPNALASTTPPWDWLLKPPSTNGYLTNVYCFIALVRFKLITPTLWALIVPSMVYMIYEWVKNRKNLALFGLLWFCGTFVIWIPLTLITDTYTYVFYFLPTIGAVCMSIGFALDRLWGMGKSTTLRYLLRGAIVVYLVVHIGVFFFFSPLLSLFAPPILVLGTP